MKDLQTVTSNEKIDELVDNNTEIINGCRWGVGDIINLGSRQLLIQELVFDETVRRRKDQLVVFQEGFCFVPGFMNLVRGHKTILKPVICVHPGPDVREELLRMFRNSCNNKTEHMQWLLRYVE